ncbi:SPFH domain/band 7 family protein [Pseudomonas phage PA1C]|nr:SPFH domain/band 7 family protein [Pseudomonas phage PA1C]
MKKYVQFVFAILIALVVTGCSFEVIPPAHKGKLLTVNGYSPEVLEPGKLTVYGRDQLILLDGSVQTKNEQLTVKMADKLDLTFTVSFRTRVAGNEQVINAMFNSITVVDNIVTLDQVYSIYGRDVVSSVSRSVLGKYKVEEVPANFDKITADLLAKLQEAMKNSPLEVSNVTLGSLKYPSVITEAIEKQAERELAIQTENNQQAIEMTKRTNALKLAEADREVELTKARTLRDQNQIVAAGISEKLLQYRALEVQEKMANSLGNSGSSIFVPYEALNSTGMSNRVFSK